MKLQMRLCSLHSMLICCTSVFVLVFKTNICLRGKMHSKSCSTFPVTNYLSI